MPITHSQSVADMREMVDDLREIIAMADRRHQEHAEAPPESGRSDPGAVVVHVPVRVLLWRLGLTHPAELELPRPIGYDGCKIAPNGETFICGSSGAIEFAGLSWRDEAGRVLWKCRPETAVHQLLELVYCAFVGEIPPGAAVVPLDGNHENCACDNLALLLHEEENASEA